jgi:hypothetical protein
MAQREQRGETLRLAARWGRVGRRCRHAQASLSDDARAAGQRPAGGRLPPATADALGLQPRGRRPGVPAAKGRDFNVEVDSLVIAARRWAGEHGYKLTTRREFDDRQEGRPKVGVYVRFDREDARRRRRAGG